MAEIDTQCSLLGYSLDDGSGIATRNRSKAGAAYKPLIEIPCSSHAGVKLHVHLELDMDLGRTSGWNIQDSKNYIRQRVPPSSFNHSDGTLMAVSA